MLFRLSKYKKYKWRYRLLIIYSNERGEYYKLNRKLYENNKYNFHKRNVKLISNIDRKNENRVILVGYDGDIKKKYKRLINPKVLLRLIDKMPMSLNKINRDINKLSLYEDYNPKTTIKNLGFKDKNTAERTLRLIKNKDINYQKQVITTLYNRAKYHPYQTKDMRDAMRIFNKYIQNL